MSTLTTSEQRAKWLAEAKLVQECDMYRDPPVPGAATKLAQAVVALSEELSEIEKAARRENEEHAIFAHNLSHLRPDLEVANRRIAALRAGLERLAYPPTSITLYVRDLLNADAVAVTAGR